MLRVIVLLLTCAAGSVDAVSYYTIGHVFTANMTGNTIHFGVALGRGNGGDIVRTGSALVGFVIGVAIGAAIVERDQSTEPWPHSVTSALGLELAVLVVAAVTWLVGLVPTLVGQQFMLVLLAVAMGVQSAAVRRLRIPGIVSTYITGTLTSLVAGEARKRLGYDRPTPEAPTHSTTLLAIVWLVYLGGAILTVTWASWNDATSLLLPILLLAASIAGAVWHRR